MYANRLGEHAHSAPAVLSGIVNKSLHHNAVSTQQVALLKGIEMWKLLVCSYGVFHLLNLSYRCNDSLAIHDVSHLFLIKGVSLDGERAVDGLYLVSLSKHQSVFLLHADGISLYEPRYVCYHVDGFG